MEASLLKERSQQREKWAWSVRQHGISKLGNVRLADWDDEGHALAATTRGLFFWDGREWRFVNQKLDPLSIRFVRSAGEGRWVIGDGNVWLYTHEGMSVLWERKQLNADCFDGSLDGTALLGGRDAENIVAVRGCVRGRWLKPLLLGDVASLTSVSRIDDDRWLVVGLADKNEPYAAIVEPLTSRMKTLRTGAVRALVTSAGRPDIGVGCAAGSGGVLLCDRVASATDTVAADLSAVAIDPIGRIVVARGGKIWIRRGAPQPGWSVIWDDDNARRPIASLYADGLVIRALTNDATILEGRTYGGRPFSQPMQGIEAVGF